MALTTGQHVTARLKKEYSLLLLHFSSSTACVIVRLKRGGTSLREKAGFKGKQANGVGTQPMKREKEVTACTALLPCYYYDVYTSPASG
jgi:hypothetical protein